jgi:hypothetical protein
MKLFEVTVIVCFIALFFGLVRLEEKIDNFTKELSSVKKVVTKNDSTLFNARVWIIKEKENGK